jgi:hypothetical protein
MRQRIQFLEEGGCGGVYAHKEQLPSSAPDSFDRELRKPVAYPFRKNG